MNMIVLVFLMHVNPYGDIQKLRPMESMEVCLQEADKINKEMAEDQKRDRKRIPYMFCKAEKTNSKIF